MFVVLEMLGCCVLNARSVKNKALSIHDLISENNLDILVLTETWLTADSPDKIVDKGCYLDIRSTVFQELT